MSESNECRHGTDLTEFDCCNCGDDATEFERWWKESYGEEDGYGEITRHIARKAWFAGMQRIIDDML